jgi:hypothetical protein
VSEALQQLIAAAQGIERLWREQARLYDAFNLEGRVARKDLEEVYRLWDRADELTEQAL